jgi:hypothetical protein
VTSPNGSPFYILDSVAPYVSFGLLLVGTTLLFIPPGENIAQLKIETTDKPDPETAGERLRETLEFLQTPSVNVTDYLEDHLIFPSGAGARSCGMVGATGLEPVTSCV